MNSERDQLVGLVQYTKLKYQRENTEQLLRHEQQVLQQLKARVVQATQRMVCDIESSEPFEQGWGNRHDHLIRCYDDSCTRVNELKGKINAIDKEISQLPMFRQQYAPSTTTAGDNPNGNN
jgi:hypothetical protein